MSQGHFNRGWFIAGLVIAFSVVWPMASSQARPSTRSYTCTALKQLVRKRGAIVMNYKGSSVYRRFVDNFGACRYPDNTVRRFRVQARDGSCALKVCYEYEPFRRR